MTQKIINGFPQYFSYTYLSGKYFGTEITEANQDYTEINLETELIGDSIALDNTESHLVTIVRDGAVLLESHGYEITSNNVIKIFPGLLRNETIEIKKLVGASGVVENITVVPPIGGSAGQPQVINEATIYTDNSETPANALGAILLAGKTRLTTHFFLNEGRIDVYINGFRSSINDGIWTLVDTNTIELDDDYSTVKMKVDIVKQKVG